MCTSCPEGRRLWTRTNNLDGGRSLKPSCRAKGWQVWANQECNRYSDGPSEWALEAHTTGPSSSLNISYSKHASEPAISFTQFHPVFPSVDRNLRKSCKPISYLIFHLSSHNFHLPPITSRQQQPSSIFYSKRYTHSHYQVSLSRSFSLPRWRGSVLEISAELTFTSPSIHTFACFDIATAIHPLPFLFLTLIAIITMSAMTRLDFICLCISLLLQNPYAKSGFSVQKRQERQSPILNPYAISFFHTFYMSGWYLLYVLIFTTVTEFPLKCATDVWLRQHA